MTKLIALCGFAGSGKDTAADILCNNLGYTKVSFASPLKDAVAAIFHWDRQGLEGVTPESRQWREQVDNWWATRLNIPHLTPRWVLQNIGTEVFRKHFHDSIWIASAEKALESTQGNIVVTDARFPNEHSLIKSKGGLLCHIDRLSARPAWYASYKETGDIPDGVHLSETAWLDAQMDFVLENNGSTKDLLDELLYGETWGIVH